MFSYRYSPDDVSSLQSDGTPIAYLVADTQEAQLKSVIELLGIPNTDPRGYSCTATAPYQVLTPEGEVLITAVDAESAYAIVQQLNRAHF